MATLIHRRNWAHRLAIAACVLAVHGGAATAQRQTAVLEGTVQDSTGAVVRNAVVTIRDADTNLTRTTQTDSIGTFRLSDLPIGTYEVRVASDGFSVFSHARVTLAIGQTARMMIVLQPAGIVEEVSVSAQPDACVSLYLAPARALQERGAVALIRKPRPSSSQVLQRQAAQKARPGGGSL